MITVMCIDDSTFSGVPHRYLKFGEIYNPVGEGADEDGKDCWLLAGFSTSYTKRGNANKGALYRKERFIIIDGETIDETELIQQREGVGV